MFRRPYMLRANPINQEQLSMLVQANQLLSQGKPLDAAPLFAQLAQAMQAGNHPRRAANLFTRAAHSYADGNDASTALTYSRQALALFLQYKMFARAKTFYTNITRKLSNHAMKQAVESLQSDFGTQIAALPVAVGPQTAAKTRHALLPTNCPKCGAPIHSEDSTWVDENTIECGYCGSLIRSG